MLDDLARHAANTGALRDRLPYVLDLLSGVTRTIEAERKGHRTPAFSSWWKSVDRSAQQAIHEMRNAELKELVTRTVADIHVEINVRAADYPGRNVADGDTLTTISWVFDGGKLHGQPVFETLRSYLRHVSDLVEEAERRLAS
jgi:uncharacterized protein YukE